jgi:thioredoxin 1
MNYKKYNELAGKPMQPPVVPPPQQLNFNQMQQRPPPQMQQQMQHTPPPQMRQQMQHTPPPQMRQQMQHTPPPQMRHSRGVSMPHVKSISEKKKHIWTHEICIFKIGADWCGPCKQIAPLVENFAQKVNQPGKVMIISENADHKLSANVTSIPCFDFYFRGKKQHRQVGADIDEFMRNVNMMISTAAGQPQAQAQKAQAYPHPAEGMQPRKRKNVPTGMQGGAYPNNVRRM